MKRNLLKGLFLACLALVAGTGLNAQDLSSGLIVHYDFETLQNTNEIPDASGNGATGVLAGTPTLVADGDGNAISFPTVADYMTLPEGVMSTLNSFSISADVKVASLNMWARVFDFGTGTGVYMFLSHHGGSGTPRFAFKNNGGEEQINVSTAFPVDKWVNLVVTFEYDDVAAKGVGKMYVDGVLSGTTAGMAITPAVLGVTNQNYIAKSQWPDPGLNGLIDNFRIYNRAISGDEVMVLNGVPAALISAYNALDLGDLSEVYDNLTLAVSSGDVKIDWTSSKENVIGLDGTVTRPEGYDENVTLTATLSYIQELDTFTLTKTFEALVKGKTEMSEIILQYNFEGENISTVDGEIKIADGTGTYAATLKNDAKIRTIGESVQYNVVDLGAGTGYVDLGTEMGPAIYALNDYTMSCYFYIDEAYTNLNANGNFIWNFSNSADAPTDQNGYIIGSLKNQSQNCTTGYWASGDQGVGLGANAPKGGWHHIAFSQSGNTGTMYIDGIQVAQNLSMTNTPAKALPKTGFTGTLYNWLGRSCYPADAYLQKTLLYGFETYSIALTGDNFILDLGVTSTIDALNAAYAENPDYVSNEIATEADALTLTGLDNVTTDLTFQTQGTSDPTIAINWLSSHPQIISNAGVVTRPDYYDFNVTLTANLVKGAQSVSKTFAAVVKANEGTAFTKDLLVRYDFQDAVGNTVTDKGEKALQGIIMNDASLRLIGDETSGTYNVLYLGDSIGYFDLGEEFGKVFSHQKDYTVSTFFRVDESYTQLESNGNFIWNFANSNKAISDPKGYFFGSLKGMSMSITSDYYPTSQNVSVGVPAVMGSWHSFVYTQQDTIGTLYLDGMTVATGTITSTPENTLLRPGFIGTLYNWLGKSSYGENGDVNLSKTLVSDFRLYSRALSDIEILALELNVGQVVMDLDAAYAANPNASVGVSTQTESPYKVYGFNGKISIENLNGSELVQVFDLSGRRVAASQANLFNVQSGIYMVKIADTVFKVLVK